MKKLFAAFLSLQLIITPVVFADSSTGLSDAYVETGTGSSGGYDFYLKQISGIGTSAIGSSILTQCLEGMKVPSIATFMAGSLVHIASEIIGAKAKNERNKKKMADLVINAEELKKSGDSSQLDALKAALEEEKETREFLKNRKEWMIAVNVIYTASVALAITEEFTQITASTAAGTLVCTELAKLECAALTVGAPACVTAQMTACTNLMGKGYLVTKKLPSHSMARKELSGICAATAVKYQLACEGYSQKALALVYGACQPAPTDGGTSMFSWTSLLGMAYGFGAGQLNKDGGQIATYGSMIISLLTAFVPAVSKLVEKSYNFPIPRSITFGVLDVLALGTTTGLAKRENISEENIEKLQKAVDAFQVVSEGDAAGVGPGVDDLGGDRNNPDVKKFEVKKLPTAKLKKNCISNSGGAWDISEKACGRPVRVGRAPLTNMGSPTLNKVSNLSSDLAQSLADGNHAKAATLAGEIGSYAARVKAEAAGLKAKYNQYLKKNNQAPLDFDKSVQQQVAGLQSAFNQAAASKNIDLASLGAPLPSSSDKKEESSSNAATSAPAGYVGVDPLAGLGGSETEPVVDIGVAEVAEQSLEDYETAEQDISKKSDVSIFKQLSNRYILNYTKMFDRKKPAEEEVVPSKN